MSPDPDDQAAAPPVAAIDCGTNSIRLLITRGPGAELTRLMRIVRLGEGVDETGRLSATALERTRVALDEYAAMITEYGAGPVRMVATSATRDAANAGDFQDMVMAALGVPPEVITGDEEARLSFDGATADLPATATPRLVVDIGGGSTEFVRGLASADAARSVDIGCVRMTERHLRTDPPSSTQIATAEADITAAVDSALAVADPDRTATELIGLAGSVTTVTALALGLTEYDPARIHHSEVGYDDVAAVTARLLGQTRAQRLEYGVMHPGRADVIAAGALVLRVIMERCGVRSVVASEHDILDGIAASLHG